MGKGYVSLSQKVEILEKRRFKDFKEGLSLLLNINDDINGNNGIEFVSKEAVANGYKSTLAYIVDVAVKNHGTTAKAIECAINMTFLNDPDYADFKFVIIPEDDRFVVILAYVS